MGSDPWVGKTPWRRDRLPTPVFLGFPGGPAGKNPPAKWETWVQSPGWEDSPGEGKGYPLQDSGLENPRDCISLCGHKGLDTTERLSLSLSLSVQEAGVGPGTGLSSGPRCSDAQA